MVFELYDLSADLFKTKQNKKNRKNKANPNKQQCRLLLYLFLAMKSELTASSCEITSTLMIS